jgi:hypothetical protein
VTYAFDAALRSVEKVQRRVMGEYTRTPGAFLSNRHCTDTKESRSHVEQGARGRFVASIFVDVQIQDNSPSTR